MAGHGALVVQNFAKSLLISVGGGRFSRMQATLRSMHHLFASVLNLESTCVTSYNVELLASLLKSVAIKDSVACWLQVLVGIDRENVKLGYY